MSPDERRRFRLGRTPRRLAVTLGICVALLLIIRLILDPIASHYARKKLERVLFVALETQRGQPVAERRVSEVRLWSPSRAEHEVLRADFELFVREYFRRGRADAITGHLGRVLQVRPKGKNADDRRDGYDELGRPTRVGKCGFYLRPAFVASLLR